MHKITEHLATVSSKLFKSIIEINNNGGSSSEDVADNIIVLDPLTTIMRLATLHLRPKGTKLSFTKHSMLFDLPTTPIHWQGIWRTISFFSGIHSCRNDLSVLKNAILAFRRIDINDSTNTSIVSNGDTAAVRHAKFTTAAIKGLTKLKQCYDEIPNDPIVHCIEFYIALLKEPPLSPMLTSFSSDETLKSLENKDDDDNKESKDAKPLSLWSESKEVLIYRLLIEAENQDDEKNYLTVSTLINSIDLLLVDADREFERAVKKK